jgi:hypothetical protein
MAPLVSELFAASFSPAAQLRHAKLGYANETQKQR